MEIHLGEKILILAFVGGEKFHNLKGKKRWALQNYLWHIVDTKISYNMNYNRVPKGGQCEHHYGIKSNNINCQKFLEENIR